VQYPHNRHVMSRMTSDMVGQTAKANWKKATNAIAAADRLRKIRASKLTDKVPTMPTIRDVTEDASPEKKSEEDADVERVRSGTIEPIEEDEGADKAQDEREEEPRKKSAAFKIGNLDEDSENEDRKRSRIRLYSAGSASMRYFTRPAFSDLMIRSFIASGDEMGPNLPDKKVSFTHVSTAEDSKDEDGGDDAERKKKRKKNKHHRRHLPMDEDLQLRRTIGSELHMDKQALPTEEDEARGLVFRDVDDMAAHRLEHQHGLSRHIIRKGSLFSSLAVNLLEVSGVPEGSEAKRKITGVMETLYGAGAKILDKSPHDLFVEMDELRGEEWVEMARWIKYEEDREEGAERWGPPHISSLSFHSLLNLRLCLEKGEIVLFTDA